MAARSTRSALSLFAVMGVLAVVTMVVLDTDNAEPDRSASQSASGDTANHEAPPSPTNLPIADLPTAAEPLAIPSAPADSPAASPQADAPPPVDIPRLHVLVFDEDDEPLEGLPIAFRVHKSGSPMGQGMATAETSEDGLAVLVLDDMPFVDGVLTYPDGHFRIAVAVPLNPPIELDLGSTIESGRLFPLVVPRAALDWLTPLRVEVVDASGARAGGVTVVLESVPRHAPTETNTIDRAETATTGEDIGIAEIPRTRLMEKMKSAGFFGYVMDYRVRVDGAFRDPPSIAVSVEPIVEEVAEEADEVPRLHLPPTGEIVLRVVDQEGETVEAGPSVALFTRPAGADDDMRWERMHRHIRTTDDGEFRYAHIGLGLECRFSVSQSGWKGSTVYAPGPSRTGETVEVVATMGPPVPTLSGRVVDEDGAPMPDTWLKFELTPDVPPAESPNASPPSAHWFSLTSDEAGRFRYPLYAPVSVEGGRTVVVHEMRRSGFPAGVIPRFASAGMPEPLPAEGDIDLGDLVLRPLPVLVSGQVFEATGTPVRQARVSYLYPYGPVDQERWLYLPVDNVSTDADGRFILHGVQRIRSLSVSATYKGLGTSAKQVVAPGTTGVRLELVPPEPEPEGGQVVGTVLMDVGVPGLEMEVYLRWEGGSEDDYVWPPGVFRFKDVPPGMATFELELQETDYTLARVEGIEVRVGETTTMDPIDLRGALRVLPVRIVKDNGNPVSQTTCWVSSPGDRGGSFRTDRDGRAGLLLPTRHERFSFRTNGYDVAECGWSEAEQTLVFVKQPD